MQLARGTTFYWMAVCVTVVGVTACARDATAQDAESYVKARAKNFIALVWRDEWERALAMVDPDAVKTQGSEGLTRIIRSNFGMSQNRHLRKRDGRYSVFGVGDLKFNSDGVSATVTIELYEAGADDGKKLLPEAATVPMRWVWKNNNWFFAP